MEVGGAEGCEKQLLEGGRVAGPDAVAKYKYKTISRKAMADYAWILLPVFQVSPKQMLTHESCAAVIKALMATVTSNVSTDVTDLLGYDLKVMLQCLNCTGEMHPANVFLGVCDHAI